MVPLGSQVTEQLNKLGISPEVLQDRLGRLQQAPVGALSNLSAAYLQASWRPGADKFGTDVADERVGIAPAWSNPTPDETLQQRARYVYRTYHRDRVRAHPTARNMSGLTGRRRQGALMVRRLHRDPVLRQSFERSSALQVVRDGRMDGTVSVAAMSSGRSATPLYPGNTNNLYGFLGAMDAAIVEYSKTLGVYSSSNPEAFFGEGRDLDLYGKGSQYGVPSPSTTGVFGMTTPGSSPVASSPTPAPVNGDQSPGLDTQVMHLKRMMDKRSQMYEIVRTVFDKYNESARTSINNLKA